MSTYERLFNELSRCGVAGQLTERLPRPESLDAGTEEANAAWERLQAAAMEHHRRTGYRFGYRLTPQLRGWEGYRVEVVDREGDTPRRFNVGRSMGWTPCHIELTNARCFGGPPASDRYHSVRVIRRIK